jgi:3-dehydroquinate synthase
MSEILKVQIKERPYSITIEAGLLSHAVEYISPLISGSAKIMLMSTKTVEKHYRQPLQSSLEEAGYKVQFILMPSGEEKKNLENVSALYDKLIGHGIDRSDLILVLGGGVAGDVAGFTAATIYRGIPFIQMPTTLLAQVDSSVGGKVGVNHPSGKNLIGSFYQPKTVLIDPSVLKTLDMRERISGFAEVLKYGFIKDAGFLEYCLKNSNDLLHLRNMDKISEMIRRSVEIKAEIVSMDEQEGGLRMLLNFGHTIGHAIEQALGYGVCRHGEAVLLGMFSALRISMLTFGLPEDTFAAHMDTMKKIPLKCGLSDLDNEKTVQAVYRDKKIRNGQLQMVLLRNIADPVIRDDVSHEHIAQTIEWLKKQFK